MTEESTPKKKPAAKAKPAARKRAPRKKPSNVVLIKNLRQVPVHLRIQGELSDKLFRVELQPRGRVGDTAAIPKTLAESYQVVSGMGILFEQITETEAKNAVFPAVGYQQGEKAEIVRDADQVIATAEDWDGKGQSPRTQARKEGQVFADVPGSDTALHEKLRSAQDEASSSTRPTADDMLPKGALQQKATIERVDGPGHGIK